MLGFGVAPVAGQNFGARKPERVRRAFQDAAWMAAGFMALFAVLCLLVPAPMIAFFSDDPAVIRVGEGYLRILAWSFVGSGVTFVVSSTFQSLGNSVPPLLTSFVRLALFAVPAFVVAGVSGFDLKWIWYLSTATILMQVAMNLALLQREFRRKLVPIETVL